ncbi:unnamed protein product [Oppiella nova]|uniref:peptide-methionine (R)-S-oxide reductase n=1 Tax=Oppiella nova TaxID=334625 RepID=A0A7R9LI53_9ACAR|nr:unnamed protein product [Oppiella nova]CAG2163883.1 unnamed protein product [Oppiella nova]
MSTPNPNPIPIHPDYFSWDKDEIYRDFWKTGIYVCSQCDHELFTSVSKYRHHSPWPAFSETLLDASVQRKRDLGEGFVGRFAFKITCGKCGNGLGHELVNEGPEGKSRF